MTQNNHHTRGIIAGVGGYLPEKILTNKDLESIVDTSDEWIVSRTGIKQRHIAADDETTGDMAIHAAKTALNQANMDGSDLDLIILATSSPDKTFPATAMQVQDAVGMGADGFAFDINAVCSGFIYALSTANQYIRAGGVKNALVIGAEKYSSILDWNDRSTCVLFGDGAGAVVIQASQDDDDDYGILSSHLHSDGRYRDFLYTDGGPATTGTAGTVKMHGKEVFRHAVNNLSNLVDQTLEANGLSPSDIDWLIPHQANKRIIDRTAKKLNLSTDKVIYTVHDHANTAAASVPLALDYAVREGKLSDNDLILMEAMGGGFTWGAVLLRWKAIDHTA
jgi:3-oxoacyl-[acyl-carrier-protein] synthase-3